jgi:uncharacterized protein YoaH (UPF0181 family)
MADKVKTFAIDSRIVERGRGCWNCKSFENQELSRQKYAAHRAERAGQLREQEANTGERAGVQLVAELDEETIEPRVQAMVAQGFSRNEAIRLIAKAEDAKLNSGPTGGHNDPRFRLFDGLITNGEAGICLVGKAPTDFVHAGFLCDGWNGKQGASMATSGHPLDPLPDELKDIVESRAKKADGK